MLLCTIVCSRSSHSHASLSGGRTSRNHSTRHTAHSHRLGQWLFDLPALTIPEFHSTHPDEYSWDLDPSGRGVTLAVDRAAVVRDPEPTAAAAAKWAAIRWKLDAAPYTGRRVQLAGTLTTRGVRKGFGAGAGMFVYAVDALGVVIAADNMSARRPGPVAFYFRSSRRCYIVVDVPEVAPPITPDSSKLEPDGWFKVVTGAEALTGSTVASGAGIW